MARRAKPKTRMIRIPCTEETYEEWWDWAEKFRNQELALIELLKLRRKRMPRY